MPQSLSIAVSDLTLDPANFRTVPQQNEENTLLALVSIHPEWFWALTNSLLNDGYLPTENIIVLRQAKPKALIVKEGNRRIAALKFIFGELSGEGVAVPDDVSEKIRNLSEEWKAANSSVPCAVYGVDEAAVVDRVVTLTHGIGELAGRDKWNAVARARHNRDKQGILAPGLDLLEKYLRVGSNVTNNWRQRWSGDYPVTVLEELLKRNATRFGFESARELSTNYPAVELLEALEDVIRDIGLGTFGYHELRYTSTLEENYGVPPFQPPPVPASTETPPSTDEASTQTPTLRHFHPVGLGREKVVTLLKEARGLTLKKHPLAFCFVLRCMFELSAKAFCHDNASKEAPTVVSNDGNDRNLQPVLLEIIRFLSGPNPGEPGKKTVQEKAMTRLLHGAKLELEQSSGILSVTSMNRLVHDPTFTLDAQHISTVFGNVFPLLDVMNQ